MAQQVVKNRHHIRHTFPRACACGEDVWFLALGGEKCLLLVVVKYVGVAVFGKVTVTLRMENSLLHQVGYGGARFVSRVKLY